MINKIMEGVKFIGLDNWITIICSLVGLLGVYLTIQFTKKQFREDKRIGVRPYLDLKIESQYCETKFSEGDFFLKFINSETLFIKGKELEEDNTSFFYVELDLENIGLGNALDYRIIDIYSKNLKLERKDKIEKKDIIRKDDRKKISLEIAKEMKKEYLNFLEEYIKVQKEIEKNLNFDRRYPDEYTVNDKLKIQSRENLYIKIEYKDILNNHYVKIFCLELYFYICKGIFDDSKNIISGKTKVLIEKNKINLIKNRRSI